MAELQKLVINYKKHVDTLKPRCYTLSIAKALQNKTVAPFLFGSITTRVAEQK